MRKTIERLTIKDGVAVFEIEIDFSCGELIPMGEVKLTVPRFLRIEGGDGKITLSLSPWGESDVDWLRKIATSLEKFFLSFVDREGEIIIPHPATNEGEEEEEEEEESLLKKVRIEI